MQMICCYWCIPLNYEVVREEKLELGVGELVRCMRRGIQRPRSNLPVAECLWVHQMPDFWWLYTVSTLKWF